MTGPAGASAVRVRREGARVLLLDHADRLLLLRAHDPHQPQRTWWFTPGGGIDAGESARECAARELLEETGYAVDPAALVGPVWERTALFDFRSEPYIQHEVFFVARVDDATRAGETAWSTNEVDTIDAIEWVTRDEVAAADIEVFPAQLRDSWSPFIDWDGRLMQLGTAGE